MTAEYYDLGQRLYAAYSGHVAARLAAAPVRRITHPVAVRARPHRTAVKVTAAAPGETERTAAGRDALSMLHDLGVRITAGAWRTLVTDDAATLPALRALAYAASRDGDHAAVAAHLAWWADRADFPGSTAVVPLLAGCRARWITGAAPGTETRAGTWRSWLGVTDEGCAGMLSILDLLHAGTPLALLDCIERDDADSWAQAQREHADASWDWRIPDSAGRAATGLRARCDAADLYAAALLTDPLYRQRAIHTGHVATGVASVPPGTRNKIDVCCDRIDTRLRSGNAVTGWTGSPADLSPATFGGTVTAAAVQGGRLVLTVSRVGMNKPAAGDRVTLHPAAPSPRVLQTGRRRYRRLYATRTSWLTTGRHPVLARRDVPLDVLVAAATD